MRSARSLHLYQPFHQSKVELHRQFRRTSQQKPTGRDEQGCPSACMARAMSCRGFSQKPGLIDFNYLLAEREGLPLRSQKSNKIRYLLQARGWRVYQSYVPKSSRMEGASPSSNLNASLSSNCAEVQLRCASSERKVRVPIVSPRAIETDTFSDFPKAYEDAIFSPTATMYLPRSSTAVLFITRIPTEREVFVPRIR